MIARITSFWYEPPSMKSWFLSPFSLLFRLLIQFRRKLYSFGLLKTHQFPIPVIVVGNLTVGGTGKTPLTIHLCQLLLEKGFKPGVVSRGYGGENKNVPVLLNKDSDTHCVGDEPYLIASRTQCPVVVCRNREKAVNYLLSHCDVDLVISDDGLQHYSMGRNIEIVVVDGQRRFGNKHCLPVGPLREPISRLKSVDFVVNNGRDYAGEYKMVLKPEVLYQLTTRQEGCVEDLKKQTIHAVAAIGSPDRFFDTLREMGLTIIEHAFSDHFQFSESDVRFEDGIVVMTEKDAVKCRQFNLDNAWVLRVGVEENFSQRLIDRLSQFTNKNPTSTLMPQQTQL